MSAAHAPALTPTRREVLDYIEAAAKPVKAYELLDVLSKRRGRTAPPTVYRVLAFLESKGFVHRIERLNAYAPCRHRDQRHTAGFLICDACGSAEEFICSTDLAIEHACRSSAFCAQHLILEVLGVCTACSPAKHASPIIPVMDTKTSAR